MQPCCVLLCLFQARFTFTRITVSEVPGTILMCRLLSFRLLMHQLLQLSSSSFPLLMHQCSRWFAVCGSSRRRRGCPSSDSNDNSDHGDDDDANGTGVVLSGTGVVSNGTGVGLNGTGVVLSGTSVVFNGTGDVLRRRMRRYIRLD